MSGQDNNFAYRTNVGIRTFTLAMVIAFMIVLIRVSYQSIKAALAKPVELLRYEQTPGAKRIGHGEVCLIKRIVSKNGDQR